jgi:hypothetical protein
MVQVVLKCFPLSGLRPCLPGDCREFSGLCVLPRVLTIINICG